MLLKRKWYSFASLPYAYRMINRWLPWCSSLCVLCLLYGVIGGLFLAPPDYQQGHGFRIIYIHIPAAFLSLAVYSIIFTSSVIFLIWRVKLADIVAKSSASIGAVYTALALISGALWGKPMWGTFWIWDARLTCELILLFLYCGYIGLRQAIRDEKRAGQAAAILAMVGMIDIPIIHFSVEWWATLHQGPTLAKFSKPSIANEMLYPLLSMILGFILCYGVFLFLKVRLEIVKREGRSEWMRACLYS